MRYVFLIPGQNVETSLRRTQTFDDMGDVGEDPRWNNFSTFHNYLYEKFPLVYGISLFLGLFL